MSRPDLAEGSDATLDSRKHQRLFRLAIGATLAALAIIVLAAWLTDLGPFAPTPEQRIANHLGHHVNCQQAGLRELAGQRETVYRCSWHRPATDSENFPGRYEQACAAVVDGRVYGVPC